MGRGVTKVMGVMNKQLNLPALTGIMREFERQNERMDMTSEVMGDALTRCWTRLASARQRNSRAYTRRRERRHRQHPRWRQLLSLWRWEQAVARHRRRQLAQVLAPWTTQALT